MFAVAFSWVPDKALPNGILAGVFHVTVGVALPTVSSFVLSDALRRIVVPL
jgi:hypothetical protein